MIKGSVHQEDIVINIYLPNIRASKQAKLITKRETTIEILTLFSTTDKQKSV